jgi:hypothetical protein
MKYNKYYLWNINFFFKGIVFQGRFCKATTSLRTNDV